MAIVERWEHLFKPEVRKKGETDFRRELVFIRGASDTEISAFVRTGAGVRVLLQSLSIADPNFRVSCPCPAGSKGRLCAHVWATLLAAEIRNPDFFDSKESILPSEPAPESIKPIPRASESASAYADERKKKQADFRKQQYQKQKQKLKEKKQASRLNSPPAFAVPPVVQSALDYFLENGFPLTDLKDEQQVKNAKRKLARIFHPDVGGTHEESILLNQHYETMMKFIEGQTL